MVTKISPRHMGEPRFGTDRDRPANGEVIPYTLSEEERLAIIVKYGAPKKPLPVKKKQISITREQLLDALRRNRSWSITMGELGIGRSQMVHLMMIHEINDGDWKNVQPKEETTMSTKEELTKEKFLELKAQGWSDTKVIQEYGFKHNIEFYNQKHAWGLMGVKLPRRKACLAQGATVEPEPEQPFDLKQEAEKRADEIIKEGVEQLNRPETTLITPEDIPQGTEIPVTGGEFIESRPIQTEQFEKAFYALPDPYIPEINIAIQIPEQPPAEIRWIVPRGRQSNRDKITANVNKNGLTFSKKASAALRESGQGFIQVGESDGRLVIKGWPEKVDNVNYTLRPINRQPERYRIGGTGIFNQLTSFGLERGRYLLEYDDGQGLWIGTRECSV